MKDIQAVLGIDVSKDKLNLALLQDRKKRPKSRVFANSWDSFEEIQQWLQEHGFERVHVCLEATSVYGHPVAAYLHAQGHVASIVNPSRVKGFAQSQLSRTKNDRADAATIAQFCAVLEPEAWTPPAPLVAKLQALNRRLEALEQMLTQERNRLKLAEPNMAALIQNHINFLKAQKEEVKKQQQELVESDESLQQQQKLLTTIVGIGEQTARGVLAEIGSVERFESARQLAAYGGFTPREYQSGTSVNGKTRMCKIGNPHLRKLLFYPALNAIQRCKEFQEYRERLLAKGKTKMQVVGAVMHKLIRVIYGVLKSGREFDPKKLFRTVEAENPDPMMLEGIVSIS